MEVRFNKFKSTKFCFHVNTEKKQQIQKVKLSRRTCKLRRSGFFDKKEQINYFNLEKGMKDERLRPLIPKKLKKN